VKYEIPKEGVTHLGIGKWIEIFESYSDSKDAETIHVRCIRIGGKTFCFGRQKRKRGAARPLRPHEGRIIALDETPYGAEFEIQF